MKPKKLIVCGWGPYKEETVIDFTKFHRAIFLITGQTGAGKTTIFDAIAYALYGVLSGQVREKGTVRSDFADEDTKTYVELYMTHKGEEYHIIRNPEYLRPKKKKSSEGAFTKEKENAAITMPDGSIIAGNQDVTRKVEELLGMDGRQFCQISMIAQGEFSRMLLASPNEKTAIFRELFGTGIYAAIQGNLKERSAKLYRDYMNYKNKMDEDVRLLSLDDEEWERLISYENIDFLAVEEYLRECLERVDKTLEEQGVLEQNLDREVLALKEEVERTRQVNKRFLELTVNLQKKEQLLKKKDSMELLSQRIQTLHAAKILSLEEKLVDEKEKAVKQNKEHLEGLLTEQDIILKEIESFKETESKKERIKEGYILATQIEEAKEQLANKMREAKRVQLLFENARNEYEEAENRAKEKQRLYEDADRLYKSAVIGIAARFVKEGEPCPVCGSMHHPKIAELSEEIPDEKQLEKLKKAMEAEKQKSSQCFENAVRLQNEHKNLLQICREAQENEKQTERKKQSFGAEIWQYVEGVTQAEFEHCLAKYLENQSKAEEKQKQIVFVKEDYEVKRCEEEEARKNFNENVMRAGFATLEEYKDAVHCLFELAVTEKEYGAYQEELASVQKLCEHLEKSLEGYVQKEETEITNEFIQKQMRLQEFRKQLQGQYVLREQIKRSLEGILQNRSKAEEIRKQYGIVKDLDDLANGNNARRLVFEQYVLAGYFERILKAANVRLSRMSDGRYELIRAKQISDGRKKDNLEILVMDYYTGKERSVKTLSGGETFKASLALALGMSDCIQEENGGLEVETLFIDEGFGALDEDSLEQSCAVLQGLAGSNRMIGIISHVAELRERIDQQIIVEKKNFGSSVRVQM